MGRTRYQRDFQLAQDGTQHLLKAQQYLTIFLQHPFDANTVAIAQQDFVAATTSFTGINEDLAFLPEGAAYLPVYGRRFHAAQHLVPLALALSQAGVAGCDILNVLIARWHGPTHAQAHAITAADLAVIAQSFRDIQASLTSTLHEADQLQSSDLQIDSHLGMLLDFVHKDAPKFQSLLTGIAQILPALPVLLGIGTPTKYLVEILDVTELRPGGGFIGNYGIVTFSEGQLLGARVTDTDLLDRPFYASGMGIPFPPAYRWFDIALGNWGLRDSNLDADFPTVARSAEAHYQREGGDGPLQGVIAITPTFIQHILHITGPIYLPEYHEVINADNLVARIHYHQLGRGAEGPDTIASPDGRSSLRKHFTAILAEHFFARVRQMMASHVAQFLQTLFNDVRSKDLQLYVNDPVAEMLLHQAHLDSAIQTPPGDSLLIVDANIASNKANISINSDLNDRIVIDRDGNAVHHTTLRYAWTVPGQNYGAALYRDYVRVYTPIRSVLRAQEGWQARGTSQAFGLEQWAGFFTLVSGQTRTITLDWIAPRISTHHEQNWHYQELIQRQAGVLWKVHTQITLPACATLTTVAGGMHATGKQSASLNQTLTENIPSSLNYTCDDPAS
ncbi:DUF4012 domain-containing protein [Dictyobacter arantiisoli]|uniref:DUF4012 domain-containing protein n=1 Tax=Dictyobacter arantiisoli TaxID=2014874 RepID=A0A5A5TG02_9CHLR|nr:DUF4012 domain-containing protein [Dictyobacter arantiisoli]GCF10086.1 hypothetical protein KDI_36500 [Dictyobacter arantiisoli]